MPAAAVASAGETEVRHATCVALDADRGLLLIGQSGSGKSGLALELMAMGLTLVSDDRTQLSRGAQGVIARYPSLANPDLRGVIEARELGLLRAQVLPQTQLRLVVDLDHIETARLPEMRFFECCGCKLPLAHRSRTPHFNAALLQFLKEDRFA
ncbi:HPr kinase/phosphorylase [Aquimixticola soesokkakensis]|uniref:HPr kinase/phosphorylase n=1 Tax=Aquimixticola soesokkakensis TaxID=1519096 RepID=A0A1Y5RIS0_9RHOB|nr:hypothetical protein [Aquimixticola soesokkakensis]SLN18529.1 HPr kinase/phosphorylase [Aquimixticola soesokkakensis]